DTVTGKLQYISSRFQKPEVNGRRPLAGNGGDTLALHIANSDGRDCRLVVLQVKCVAGGVGPDFYMSRGKFRHGCNGSTFVLTEKAPDLNTGTEVHARISTQQRKNIRSWPGMTSTRNRKSFNRMTVNSSGVYESFGRCIIIRINIRNNL